MSWRVGLFTLIVAVGLACTPPPPAEPEAVEPEASAAAESVSRTSQDGPVRATVELTPVAPRLGDPLSLTLTVEAEADVSIEMPAFGEALGRFSIVDFTPRLQTRPDGSTLASQRYTLQAPMSGRQRIPPLRVEFVDGRGDPDDVAVRELLTEELLLEIVSVLPEGTLLDELRPVRAQLDPLPSPDATRNGVALGLVLAVAVAIGAWLWWRRFAEQRARVTAYDRALGRLAKLERGGLPSPDEADGWYVELSDIVRRYLEDRFSVRAPELTTEEFLNEARRSAELTEPHRELLSAFLERCDRVKFAAYHPEPEESGGVLQTARRFLDETRLRPEQETARPAPSAA